MSTSTAKSNNIAQGFIGELKQEAISTRKSFERIPEDKFDFKPHEKSMTMIQLASHVAEMFGWITATCKKDQIDFAAGDYVPFKPETTADLVEAFDKHLAEALAALEEVDDEKMMEIWTLRNGEQVYFSMPRVQAIRAFAINHIIHHRGQLSVYLRLNDIPVPSLYGPSADEQM